MLVFFQVVSVNSLLLDYCKVVFTIFSWTTVKLLYFAVIKFCDFVHKLILSPFIFAILSFERIRGFFYENAL